MPLFSGRTPESLLSRNDSKNAATTCKGITSSGRPCRRSLGAAKLQSDGVVALAPVETVEGKAEAAAFFCWQHKDQAERLADLSNPPGNETHILPLQERTSIDTLVAKLGVLDVLDEDSQSTLDARKTGAPPARARRVERPPTWKEVHGPLLVVPEDLAPKRQSHHQQRADAPRASRGSRQSQRQPSFWQLLCCMSHGNDDGDYLEVRRHKNRDRQHERPETSYRPPLDSRTWPEAELRSIKPMADAKTRSIPTEVPYQSETPTHRNRRGTDAPRKVSSSTPRVHCVGDEGVTGKVYVPREGADGPTCQLPQPSIPGQTYTPSAPCPIARKPLAEKPVRPVNGRSPSSHTAQLLSFIPQSLSPQTTSLLLAELAKPISAHDDLGYIYIFWLTDTDAPPSSSTAASLLNLPSPGRIGGRRQSDVLRDFSKTSNTLNNNSNDAKKTIILKIGRASNVHRRMSEWTRQCGYNLSLVRFYPYVPMSPSTSPAGTPTGTPQKPSDVVRKVPHAHRVERLIHIELAEKRVKRDCEVCGKEHREWFEVEASRRGIAEVDEVVRRWVGWSERQSE